MSEVTRACLKIRVRFQTAGGVTVTSEQCPCKPLYDVMQRTLGFSSFSGGENCGWSMETQETASLRRENIKVDISFRV
jgi:hypothetical protein